MNMDIIRGIELTTISAGLVIEALQSLGVELSRREDRAEDFALVEYLINDLQDTFEL